MNKSIVAFRVDGNFSNYTGPFLGDEFLRKGWFLYVSDNNLNLDSEFKFNKKTESSSSGSIQIRTMSTDLSDVYPPGDKIKNKILKDKTKDFPTSISDSHLNVSVAFLDFASL